MASGNELTDNTVKESEKTRTIMATTQVTG